MKLFRFNKKTTSAPLLLTPDDQEWVEDNFQWLLETYGSPPRASMVILSKDYFPTLFSDSAPSIQTLIAEVASLFDLDKVEISYQLHEDLRDSMNVPYLSEGKPFLTEIEQTSSGYMVHIANSLIKRPFRLISQLLYECTKIRLLEDQLPFDNGEETDLFLYLAGTFFGVGVPLSQSLIDIGKKADPLWETTWNYTSDMPEEVMAYALALYCQLTEQEDLEWTQLLSNSLQNKLTQAFALIADNPPAFCSQNERDAFVLLPIINKTFELQDFDESLRLSHQVLSLTQFETTKVYMYNTIGYCLIRQQVYAESLSYFQKALEIDPDYGIAYDNLAYAHIQLKNLDQALGYLQQAQQTDNNQPAYHHRNWALYYWANAEIDEAQSYFDQAFQLSNSTVDLLELHYAEFLKSQAQLEQARIYLQQAINKGEPEALARRDSF